MPDYQTSNTMSGTQQAVASAYKTMVEIHAVTATLRRGRLFDFSVGADGTPADNALVWDISRSSAAGTPNAAITPSPLDIGDTASLMTAGGNHTAEPTYGVSLWSLAVNQRASYRWVCSPGKELVWAATNLVGVGLRVKSAAYTGTAVADAYHTE